MSRTKTKSKNFEHDLSSELSKRIKQSNLEPHGFQDKENTAKRRLEYNSATTKTENVSTSVSKNEEKRKRAPLLDWNKKSNSLSNIRINSPLIQSFENVSVKNNFAINKRNSVCCNCKGLKRNGTSKTTGNVSKKLPLRSLSESSLLPKQSKVVSSLNTTLLQTPKKYQLKKIPEYEMLYIPTLQSLTRTVSTDRGCNISSPKSEEDNFTLDNEKQTQTSCNSFDSKSSGINNTNDSFGFKKNVKFASPLDERLESSNFDLSLNPAKILHDGIPSLKKKILKKQLNQPSGFLGVVNLDPNSNKVPPGILYSEYMFDNITHLIQKEDNLKLPQLFVHKKRSIAPCRAAVVNWLHKLQQCLGSDTSVFFMSVRLFDKLLSILPISRSNMQLIGMITYWIAHKYGDIINCITTSELSELANNVYPIKLLLYYEQRILNILKFDILVEEPMIFVRYYIYILKICESNMVSFCANYLLDCLALSLQMNTFPLSIQAAGSVFLSLTFLDIDINIWKKTEDHPGYYPIEKLYYINDNIIQNVLLVQDDNYEFREPYFKYLTERYGCISQIVKLKLKKNVITCVQ